MLILQDSTMNVLCRIIQETTYNIKHFMLVTNNVALLLTRKHLGSDDLRVRETNSATPHFFHHTRTETSSDKSLHLKFHLCHNFCKLLETPTRPLPLSTCREPVAVTASTPSHPGTGTRQDSSTSAPQGRQAEARELGHVARLPVSRGLSMNHTSSDRNRDTKYCSSQLVPGCPRRTGRK